MKQGSVFFHVVDGLVSHRIGSKGLPVVALSLFMSFSPSANAYSDGSNLRIGSKDLHGQVVISTQSEPGEVERLCKDGVIKGFHKQEHHVLFCENNSGVTVIELRRPEVHGLVDRINGKDGNDELAGLFQKVRQEFEPRSPIPRRILEMREAEMLATEQVEVEGNSAEALEDAVPSARSASFDFCNGIDATGQFGLQICGGPFFAAYDTKRCHPHPSRRVLEACEWYHSGYTPCGGMGTEFVTCGDRGFVRVQILRRDSIGADDDYQTYNDFYTGPGLRATFVHYSADWWGDTFVVSLNSQNSGAWVRALVGFNGD